MTLDDDDVLYCAPHQPGSVCCCATGHSGNVRNSTALSLPHTTHLSGQSPHPWNTHCRCSLSEYEDRRNDSNGGFVRDERQLMRALVILCVTSALALGVWNNLLVLSRFFWGRWTYLILSATALVSALSVYYAKCLVHQWGSRRIILLAQAAILLLVTVHFGQSLPLYAVSALFVGATSGPFFLAQLDFVQSFTVRLVHVSKHIRRYQAEQHQKLLHLLLVSPSHIVGHALFVSLVWATTSSRDYSIRSNAGDSFDRSRNGSQSLRPDRVRNWFCREQTCGSVLYIFDQPAVRPDWSWMFLKAENPLLATCLALTFSLVLVAVLTLLFGMFRRDGHVHLREQDPLERSILASSIRHVLLRTFSDTHLRLLLPTAFYTGLLQAFFFADFQKNFVACALGVEAVGVVMLTRGLVGLGATWLVHEFVKHIRRSLVVAAGALCQVAVLSILALWRTDADPPLYYVVAACWSLAGAIWETVLLTNVLRSFAPDQWSTSFLTIFSFSLLGQAAGFGVAESVCLRFKLYSLFIVLLFALPFLRCAERRLERLEKLSGNAGGTGSSV